MKILHRTLRGQSGYTMLHLMVFLAFSGAIVATALKHEAVQKKTEFYDYAAEIVRTHQRAALRMRAASGAWPGTPSALIAGGYLPAGYDVSPWGTTYVYSIVGSDFRVRVNTDSSAAAQNMAGRLIRGSVTGNAVLTEIDPPGMESSHDALYARDGSRPLTGAMNANNQQINNASRVEANQFVDNNNNAFYADPASRSQFSTMDISSMRDRDNTAYTWDGSGTSTMNNISLDGTIVDRDNGSFVLNPDGYNRINQAQIDRMAGIWRDDNNSAYQLDLSGTTITNRHDVNDLRLKQVVTEGSTCSNDRERIAKNSNGEVLACINNGSNWRWRRSEGVEQQSNLRGWCSDATPNKWVPGTSAPSAIAPARLVFGCQTSNGTTRCANYCSCESGYALVHTGFSWSQAEWDTRRYSCRKI